MNTARKLIANELLPVYQTTDTGEKIVDGRELHEFLNVSSKFADWIKNRIAKYGFIENEDFVSVSKILENGGKQQDYILKIDMAKELAMVENNEQGRQARKYFIEVEKRMHNVVNMPRVPLYTPYPEIDRADRLLTMLHTHKDLINSNVNHAIQAQVVELITGKPLLDAPTKTKPPGLGTAAIASFLGVSVQKVTCTVKKHDLKKPEYGSVYSYIFRGASKDIFLFNEVGKDKIVSLLNPLELAQDQEQIAR